MKEQYTIIESVYLAQALSFLGFRYYKYQDQGKTVYSFKNNDKFNKFYTELVLLRDKSYQTKNIG